MVNVLHLNSTSLHLLLSPNGELTCQPCFAYRENSDWVFNDIARSQFHTDATDHTLNTYVSDCVQDRKIHQDGWQGTAVDIVYQQLSRLLQGAHGVILILSSIFSKTQIACLTGVLQAIVKPVIVVKAPLAYSYFLPTGTYSMVEIEMHDIVLSELDIADGSASIKQSKVYSNIGLQSIYSEQYSLIRDAFVRRHRYDPDCTTANKAKLLQQLQHAMRTDKTGDLHLSVDNYEVYIEQEQMSRVLQDKLPVRSDPPHYIISSPLIPLHSMISEIPCLPNLNPTIAKALTDSECLQHESTDEVRVFHTIEHQYLSPLSQNSPSKQPASSEAI